MMLGSNPNQNMRNRAGPNMAPSRESDFVAAAMEAD